MVFCVEESAFRQYNDDVYERTTEAEVANRVSDLFRKCVRALTSCDKLDLSKLVAKKQVILQSIVARAKGFRSELPPFMVVGGRLHQGKRAIAGEGGGTLGALYDPFRLVYDPDVGTRIPALQLPANLSPDRLRNRQQLLQSLDSARRSLDTGSQRTIDDYRAQALALLTSPDATRMFDISQERPELADRYGRTRFGQSCLLARRLVEHGVPFVQVNWSDHVEAEEDAGDGGWDNH